MNEDKEVIRKRVKDFKIKIVKGLTDEQINNIKNALKDRLSQNTGRRILSQDKLYKKSLKIILNQCGADSFDEVKALQYETLLRKAKQCFMS